MATARKKTPARKKAPARKKKAGTTRKKTAKKKASARRATQRSILVPVDLSKRAETAVEYAAMLAHGLGAELVLATNVNLPERALLEEMMEDPGDSLDEVAHPQWTRFGYLALPKGTAQEWLAPVYVAEIDIDAGEEAQGYVLVAPGSSSGLLPHLPSAEDAIDERPSRRPNGSG